MLSHFPARLLHHLFDSPSLLASLQLLFLPHMFGGLSLFPSSFAFTFRVLSCPSLCTYPLLYSLLTAFSLCLHDLDVFRKYLVTAPCPRTPALPSQLFHLADFILCTL